MDRRPDLIVMGRKFSRAGTEPLTYVDGNGPRSFEPRMPLLERSGIVLNQKFLTNFRDQQFDNNSSRNGKRPRQDASQDESERPPKAQRNVIQSSVGLMRAPERPSNPIATSSIPVPPGVPRERSSSVGTRFLKQSAPISRTLQPLPASLPGIPHDAFSNTFHAQAFSSASGVSPSRPASSARLAGPKGSVLPRESASSPILIPSVSSASPRQSTHRGAITNSNSRSYKISFWIVASWLFVLPL